MISIAGLVLCPSLITPSNQTLCVKIGANAYIITYTVAIK